MLVGHLYDFFGKKSIEVFCPFFNWIVCFLDIESYELFNILDINLLSDISFANIFSHSIGCLFMLLLVSFTVQKLSSLIWCSLIYLFLLLFLLPEETDPKKILLRFMSRNVLPVLSSRNFMVSGLTFRSLIHFEFIFLYGVRKCSNFILSHTPVQFSQHHLLKRLSFLHCISLPPLS